MSQFPDPVRLSQLKGISIYFEDDFYQTAELVLKLYEGKRKRFNERGITRPTVYGMIRTFASLADECNPRTAIVEQEVAKRQLPLAATIKFDEEA